uniref:F-box domain-containing protein n=1 Tax=Strongyloides venezuelensis TaxID=75913 RepID=A0A0K0F3Y4_STRVS
MSLLNDDCWLIIFSNLSIKERVKCERVCKRFYHVLRNYNRGYIKEKKIDFFSILITNFEKLYNKEKLNYLPCISGIMQRCGRNLEHISFGKKWLSLKQDVIDEMESYTEKLRYINLSGVMLIGSICKFLSKNAKTLEILNLDECHFYDEECIKDDINNIFGKFTNLKKLHLQKNCMSLSKLYQVNRDLKVLDLTYPIYFNIYEFNTFLKNHLSLEELYLNGIQTLNSESIQLISSLKNLLVLEIGNLATTQLPISLLSNVKTLTTLSINYVTSFDDMILEILLHALNNLQSLSLTHCINISNFSSLKLAKKLCNLTITHSNTLCDLDMEYLSQNKTLSSVKIQRCPFLTNVSINNLIKNCPLNRVEIVDCPAIGDASLYVIAKSTKVYKIISFEGCCNVTNEGVKALAKMRSLDELINLDVSHIKNVDDSAIEKLCEELRNKKTNRQKLLGICVKQTSVTKFIENKVNDKINLYY